MIVVKEHASTVRNRTGKVRFARAMPTTNPRTGMLWERDCNSIILVIQSKCGKFLDLNSACSKVLVHVEIFQFQDMLNKSERYCDETNIL